MRVPFYQVDAFTRARFAGNPAAVLLLPDYPEEATLQAIAAENNLAETAFLVRYANGYRLRWFTPTVEVPLCGHATLASAAVVLERLEPGRDEVVFQTASGPLSVVRTNDGFLMNFPARPPKEALPAEVLADALGVMPLEVHLDEFNYLAVLADPRTVRDLSPDLEAIARLDRAGVIVTAAGDGEHDFTSRYFAPAKGIPEDPVTGGAHCMLVPFWADRLGRTDFRAYQASRRGGELLCRLAGERVELEGSCVFYLEGEATI
jgi:PhzF family phenazine biosynthesis protein